MQFATATDAEVIALANDYMDNLMDASTRIDHAAHTRDFSDRLKAIVTPQYLSWICQTYQAEKGFFGAREFVALFRRPNGAAIVWKQAFTQQEGDFVAEMLLIEQGGKIIIDHVMVF